MHLCLVKLCADVFLTFFMLVEQGRSILKKGERGDGSVYPPSFQFQHCFRCLFQDGSCASFGASQAVGDQSLTLFQAHLRDLHPQSPVCGLGWRW